MWPHLGQIFCGGMLSAGLSAGLSFSRIAEEATASKPQAIQRFSSPGIRLLHCWHRCIFTSDLLVESERGGPCKRVGRSRCFSRLLSSMKSGWMQFCSPERPHCIQCRCPDVQLSDSHSWKILQMTCLPQASRATEGRAYGHCQPGEYPVPKAHFYLYVTFIT